MKGFYGVVLYGPQGAKGTPAVAYAPLGIVSRANRRIPAGLEKLFSVGSRDPVEISEGMTSAEVGLQLVLEDPHFIQYAVPTAGLLTWLTMKLGYDYGLEHYQTVVQDAKVNTLGLRLEAGGRMTADVALIGGKTVTTAADPGDMSFLDARAYRWFEAVWDEVVELRAIAIDLNNNLDAIPVIAGSGTTRDPDRIWDYLEEGRNDVSGTITVRAGDASEDAARDLQACLLTGADHTLTLTSCGDISPVQSVVFTIHDLKYEAEDFQLQNDQDSVFELPFQASALEIAG